MGPPSHGNPALTNLNELDRTLESEDCQRRYRRLFDNAPLVAYSLDSQLCTLCISPYCSKVFGFSPEEILEDNHFWNNHIHPEDKQRVSLGRERSLKEGKSLTLEYRIIHRDRSVRYIINHTIPVTRDHQLICIDGFVFDMTARKYLEEQLVLTERIKVLNDMSLSVAHEIRNPLTSIGGFARLLERRMALDDPNRAHLDIILKDVSRLEVTLNRVLNSLKRIRLRTQPCNINDILSNILNQMSHEFHHMGIHLTTNLGSRIPQIELDRHLIEEGLRSIIRTTLQSMETGSELTITTSINHHQVAIEISGINLNPQPLDECQLFFPFYREPAFNEGVGIPLSQQIITQHGGSVVFRNGSDQAASLIITLPVSSSGPST
jgi:PAS domain S-box-containing protein